MAKTVWTIRMVRSQRLLLKKEKRYSLATPGCSLKIHKNTFNNQTIREKNGKAKRAWFCKHVKKSGLIPKSLLLSQHMECKLRSLKFTWHIHSMSSTPGALCFPYGPANIWQSTPSTSYDLQQNHWSTSFHSIPVVTFLAEVPRLSLWNVNKHSIIQASFRDLGCLIISFHGWNILLHLLCPVRAWIWKSTWIKFAHHPKALRPSFWRLQAPGFFAREVARFLSLPIMKPQVSHLPLNPGCLIGSLRMIYYNHQITV